MFRHCVLLKFIEQATNEQKQEVFESIIGIPNQIAAAMSDDGIEPLTISYSVGFNAGTRDDNYDLVVIGDFETQDDYDIYAAHPKHLEVISVSIAPILENRSAIQYILEA
jgi:hypothetical protein